MAYGDRAHFERWAADKHGRAKTPEFYVRSHEPDLPGPEADAKAAALREEWGLVKKSEAAGKKRAAAKESAPRRARAAPIPRAAEPPREASPAEKAIAAYADALRRKVAADARVKERQASLNEAIVERDACDHDIRETWAALERMNAQLAASAAVAAAPSGDEGSSSDAPASHRSKRPGRPKNGDQPVEG